VKRVISVSLGSSKRDHTVETEILGQPFRIERRGTDGDTEKAIALFKELDGQVDAFGLGGTDLYLYAADKRFVLKSAEKFVKAVRKSPIVDGSGLKNTLERKVINHLQSSGKYDFRGKKALIVCAADRFGMAEAMAKAGAQMTYGDLIFTLGIPIPLHSLNTLKNIATVIMPVVSRLPFEWLYPTGEKQEKVQAGSKFNKYYHAADIVAGDFHLIRRFMPARLDGKVIITNTVTKEDVALLKERGVQTLITTTPELEGRSFGTNVMEGVLIALTGKPPMKVTPADYEELIDRIGFLPRIEHLN